MRDYTKIEAWRRADDLTVAIYAATRAFPREEAYGLTSQIRRASYSVPSNIAEGSARETKRDYLHFLCGALHGLIEAVEKEAGKLGKIVASVTSLLVLCCFRLGSSSPVVP